jgi:predicted enzyme related to lactoylglutathione lyase
MRALGAGFYLWPELRVRDGAKAGHFYASILGCTLEALPEGAVLLSLDDRAFAAIDELSENERTQGIADHWRLYLVKGSKVRRGLTPPPRPRADRITGARLAATQAARHFGDRCAAGREAVLWTELGTKDALESSEVSTLLQAAMNEPLEADHARGSGVLPLIYCNGEERARVGTLVGSVDSHGTQVANVCLVVDDCSGALARARRAGATIVGNPAELETDGRLAAVIDPQGAPFYCWQPAVNAAVLDSGRSVRNSATPWAGALDAPPPRVKVS